MTTANPHDLKSARQIAFTAAHPELVDALRDYTGSHPFVLKMIQALDTWGGLTYAQANAVNRVLSTARINEDAPGGPIERGHVGTPKERLRGQPVRVIFSRLVRDAVFPQGPTYLVKLETREGNHLSWFTGKSVEPFKDFRPATFTVGSHETYQGIKQTKITRLAWE